MTAKQEVFAMAEMIGANVEAGRDNTGFNIRVEAPKDNHWDEGVHEIVAFQFSGFKTNELWREVLERMQEGTEPCSCECEWW